MSVEAAKQNVALAREAYRGGFFLTADVYMRRAMGEVNRLRRPDWQRQIFTVRNRLRPLARRHMIEIARSIQAGE